jgi:GNAT superfamily N-acetyltransferase
MISYQRESAATVVQEIVPLLYLHWQEIAHYKDIPLDPDTDAYLALDGAGALRVYTARADGQLIGYCIYFVRPNIHYRTSLQAVQDVLFLLPEHRKGRVGFGLIHFADEQLRAEGVQAAYQHVKKSHDFGPLLERMGYEHVDTIYGRRLD